MKRNKSLVGFLMVCFVVTSSFLISFDSKAAVFEEYVDYAEPATSDTQGYLSVLLKDNRTGNSKVMTFFWYCVGVKGGVYAPVYMYLNIQPNKLEFAPGGAGSGAGSLDSAYYCLSYYDEYNKLHLVKYSSSERYTFTYSDYTFYAFNYSGNVGQVNCGITNQSFAVFFNDDGQVQKLSQIYSAILSSNTLSNTQIDKLTEIINQNASIKQTVDSVLSYTMSCYNVLIESNDLSQQQLNKINDVLTSVLTIQGEVKKMNATLDMINTWCKSANEKLQWIGNNLQVVITQQQETNSWLQKIWTSIQRFFDSDTADKNKVDDFANNSNAQSQNIDALNQQSQSEKVDINSASGSVDSYIDTNAISSYSGVLASFTGNPHILQFILIVLAVGLVSYVLFGKR